MLSDKSLFCFSWEVIFFLLLICRIPLNLVLFHGKWTKAQLKPAVICDVLSLEEGFFGSLKVRCGHAFVLALYKRPIVRLQRSSKSTCLYGAGEG